MVNAPEDMEADDFLEFLRSSIRLLATDAAADRVIEDVRQQYGGEQLYISKRAGAVKMQILRDWRHGVSVTDICKRHRVSRGWVYRVINS